VSERWGVVGRCDTVDVRPDGAVELVEHKATNVRREPTVTGPMRVQLTLQRQAPAGGWLRGPRCRHLVEQPQHARHR